MLGQAFSTIEAVATATAVRPPLVTLDAACVATVRDAMAGLRTAIDAIAG